MRMLAEALLLAAACLTHSTTTTPPDSSISFDIEAAGWSALRASR